MGYKKPKGRVTQKRKRSKLGYRDRHVSKRDPSHDPDMHARKMQRFTMFVGVANERVARLGRCERRIQGKLGRRET